MFLSYPIWLFLGCQNHIAEEYALRKTEILREPSVLAENWSPDILLRLSYERISDLAAQILSQNLESIPALRKDVLGLKLTLQPQLSVQKLSVSDAPSAEDVNIQLVLKGPLEWSVGPKKGSEESTFRIRAVAGITVQDGQLSMQIKELDSITASIASLKISPLQPSNFNSSIEEWVSSWIKDQILRTPPIQMGKINLPVRGIRLNSTAQSEHIELRSNINHPKSLPKATETLTKEWELWVHQDTVLGWTQQKAFSMGTIGYGVAIDPTALSIQEDNFELALRLWKIEGNGLWWRDYTANGNITQQANRLKLKGNTVTEGAKSAHAGIVDPLALIAEGFILDGISEQLSQSLPTKKSKTIQDLRWSLELETWSGTGEILQLGGRIDVSEKKSTKPNK